MPEARGWYIEAAGLDCPLSKGNQAPHLRYERPYQKIPKSRFFYYFKKIGESSSLESSMKRFLGRFKLNQSKSKLMKTMISLHVLYLKPILKLS